MDILNEKEQDRDRQEGAGPTPPPEDVGAKAVATKSVVLTAKDEAIINRIYEKIMADVNARTRELEDTLTSLSSLVGSMGMAPPLATAPGEIPTAPKSLQATMVGGQFNCPECGLRISGTSLTPVQGQGPVYEHSFDDSPRLMGGGGDPKCKYKGKKFRAPIIALEFVVPPSLTKAGE